MRKVLNTIKIPVYLLYFEIIVEVGNILIQYIVYIYLLIISTYKKPIIKDQTKETKKKKTGFY